MCECGDDDDTKFGFPFSFRSSGLCIHTYLTQHEHNISHEEEKQMKQFNSTVQETWEERKRNSAPNELLPHLHYSWACQPTFLLNCANAETDKVPRESISRFFCLPSIVLRTFLGYDFAQVCF